MNEDNYKVYLVQLPTGVRGAIRIDETGFASIYINASLSYFEQKNAFRHELRHLRRGDMFSMRSIRRIEEKPCHARRNKS